MTHTVFRHRLRVRYHETDQQGIVYHARYLEYMDDAMTEYFRHLGWSYQRLLHEGCDPSLVRTTINFLRPASFEDELAVAVRPVRIGNRSFTLGFEVSNAQGSELLLSGETVYVNFDAASRKSRPLPERVRERMAQDLLATPTPQKPALDQPPPIPD
ncbi:MAG TPA: thioesterase family protein [Burkholderiaceae bacterium]|nr:thioesterase family protein [Burkholderiaceae bacterium]